jgi:HAE1 family hydrophobic/amphiphilic exporter-1
MMPTLREIQAKIFDRINPAVQFSVNRYVLAIGIFVAIFAFGVTATMNLGVDLMPSVNIPVVNVSITYPGATPSVIDQQITQVVEGQISTLAGVTDISASSSQGSSRVTIQFGIDSDKNAMANQVSARVAAVTRRLPTGINPPTVQTFDPNAQAIIQFGISGGSDSMENVGDWVTNDLAPRLERVDGVANITVDGAPTRQFQVLLDPNKLAYYKLNPQQVTAAITAAAIDQPIGSITTNRNTITFATKNQPEGIDTIKNILVDATKGVAVDDVALVQDVPVPSNFDRINGVPVVLVSIQKSADGNSVAVAKGVRDFLKAQTLPKGYTLTISNDTTGPITASIDSTYKELGLTALVVAIIVLLFLGRLNTAFSVILAIPIALSAAPILYQLMGFSFNLVSLLALIIAIGIVVDDSIVVSENVDRYRAMGYSLKEAVLKGASEVFSAVVASSLSLLSVLLPVSFIGGVIGRYIMQFSLGLSAAVFFSLLEAILFLTVRLAYTPESKDFTWKDFLESWGRLPQSFQWALKSFYKGIPIFLAGVILALLAFFKLWLWMPALLAWPLFLALGSYVLRILLTFFQSLTTTLHNITEFGLEWVRDKYVKVLGKSLGASVWILVGCAVFFVGTITFIWPQVPFNFVPQSDSGAINASIRLPQGTPASYSNELAGRMEGWLLSQKEVATVQTSVGSGGVGGFGGNANFTIQLIPVEKRRGSFLLAQDYRTKLLAVFRDKPEARISVNAGGFGGGGFGQGSTVSFTLSSSDFNALLSTNDAIIANLQANPWVNDVSSGLSNTNLENDFIPDVNLLQGTGLSTSTVATALQTYASGVQAANVETGGKTFPIQVQVDPIYLTGTQSLLNLSVFSTATQTLYQARQVGAFQLTPVPATLSRSNRQYSTSLDISLKTGAPPALVFQKQINADLTKAGILGGKVNFAPESRTSFNGLSSQLAASAPIAFLLALFLAYLVMGAQFNSWKYPIYLLLPVPLALVGAVWFLFFNGGGMDIFGMLGMLMLIGLSAKNAILYLDFVVERIELMPLRDALIEAATLRFRPIIMTTLTVLVISFPLIFNSGQGSEFGQKMGIVMLGGILSSAILTFFVVPAAFWLFERRKLQEKHLGLEGPGEATPLTGPTPTDILDKP